MRLIAALFFDALLGDPRRFPHPVVGVGWLIRFYESRFYEGEDKKKRGAFFCAAVVSTVGVVTVLCLLLASFNRFFYNAVVIYLLYAALAWRSLKDGTLPVALALFDRDVPRARTALSRVVGRDTESLDEAGIIRATVETTGENFVDGVVSVLFFALAGYLLAGGAGAAVCVWLFKAVSTLDSMVGYDDERYRDFGRFSARLDDALNFIPARFGGVIALLAGACLGYPALRALKIFLRDRKKHKSPNSAHGESAFAGLLGISLGGGAFYGGEFEEKPLIGDAVREPEAADILRGHALLDASVALCALIILLILPLARLWGA